MGCGLTVTFVDCGRDLIERMKDICAVLLGTYKAPLDASHPLGAQELPKWAADRRLRLLSVFLWFLLWPKSLSAVAPAQEIVYRCVPIVLLLVSCAENYGRPRCSWSVRERIGDAINGLLGGSW